MAYVESLDDALRSTTIEPEGGQKGRDASVSSCVASGDPSASSFGDLSAGHYRPNTLITVHRKQYHPSVSETSSDEECDQIDNSPPVPSAPHGAVIGNYVNVGTSF